MPFERSRWVTVDEFAKITGMTEKAVRRRLERRQLPFSRALGPRSTRIDLKAVEERMELGCRQPETRTRKREGGARV